MLIMLLGTNYAFSYQLCSKLCRHNWESPKGHVMLSGVGEGGGQGGGGGGQLPPPPTLGHYCTLKFNEEKIASCSTVAT